MAQTKSEMSFRVIQKDVTSKNIPPCCRLTWKEAKNVYILHVVYYGFLLFFWTETWNVSWVSSNHSFINYASSAFLSFPPSPRHSNPPRGGFVDRHLPKRGSLLGALLFLGAPCQEEWQKRLISRDSYLQLRGVKVHSGLLLRHSRALQCVAMALWFFFFLKRKLYVDNNNDDDICWLSIFNKSFLTSAQ